MAGTLDVIEIAVRPELQIESELMEMLAGHTIVVEVLVKIDFAVPIQVVQTCDLIPTEHIDLAVDNLQAEWLE